MNLTAHTFAAMGTQVSFWTEGDGERVGRALAAGEAFIRSFETTLSRFDPQSELSRLNADPAAVVPASPLMIRFVSTAIAAAERSGGLVDPTLLGEVIAAGYDRSLSGAAPARFDSTAQQHHPARPLDAARWRSIDVRGTTIARPSGVGIDSGGVGKGLAADMAFATITRVLGPDASLIVDCGGDMRVSDSPQTIIVESPWLTSGSLTLNCSGGGVATSGIDRRIWHKPDGQLAHHLIDPSTGEPAWTGIVSVTAIGNDAVDAETTAKTALLGGPKSARELLADRGGVVSLAGGEVQIISAGGAVQTIA